MEIHHCELFFNSQKNKNSVKIKTKMIFDNELNEKQISFLQIRSFSIVVQTNVDAMLKNTLNIIYYDILLLASIFI
jgi:hypothetical protein